MNNNVYKIVHSGLGPGNDLAGLLTLGLNVNPTFSALGSFGIDAKSRLNALDVDKREAMYSLDEAILTGDGSEWLYGDGSVMMWPEPSDSDSGRVKSRLDNLEVSRG